MPGECGGLPGGFPLPPPSSIPDFPSPIQCPEFGPCLPSQNPGNSFVCCPPYYPPVVIIPSCSYDMGSISCWGRRPQGGRRSPGSYFWKGITSRLSGKSHQKSSADNRSKNVLIPAFI